MSEVKREHLAGLELAIDRWNAAPNVAAFLAELRSVASQASAAPEQDGATKFLLVSTPDGLQWTTKYGSKDHDRAKRAAHLIIEPLYRHADPSEVAQLRAWKFCPECGCEAIHHQEGNHKQCANCYQEWFSDMDYTDVVRTNLAGKFRDKDAVIEAATKRADAAERKLGELTAALKFYADSEHFHFESDNWDSVSGEPANIMWHSEEADFVEDGEVARTALSAIAEPAECCQPTEAELKLIADGEYRAEELWGGSRPTCPKCIGKATEGQTNE